MSQIVSTCQQICNSPLNTSQSKNLWSFPKSSRFAKLENPNNCAVAFYDLPDQKDRRKAGIGYSNKYDLTKQNEKTPAPDQYQIQGDVDFNKQKNKGFQFGVSRDKMWQTGILGGLNKITPGILEQLIYHKKKGPGKYELPSTLSHTKYTMRPKTHADIMILTKGIPGPGAYEAIPAINDKGRYTLSKFSNSCATLINPSRSRRFQDQYKTDVPGPGNYKLENVGIQKTGAYPLSNLSSSKCRSFPHEERRTGQSLNPKTPGPGSYRLPSDFGYYESKSKSMEKLPEAK